MALACIQATATYQNTKVHINQGYTQLLELSQVWNSKYLGRKHDNDNEKSTKLQKNKRPESTIEQQQLITFTLRTTLYTCLLVGKRIVAQQYPSILPMHTHTHFLYCQKPEKMRKCWKMTKPDNNSKDYQWFSCMWKCVLFNAQQQCQPQQQPPFSFQLLSASSLFTIDSAIVLTMELLHSAFVNISTGWHSLNKAPQNIHSNMNSEASVLLVHGEKRLSKHPHELKDIVWYFSTGSLLFTRNGIYQQKLCLLYTWGPVLSI